jgi:outer membrane receptor protein involved in Fe transport
VSDPWFPRLRRLTLTVSIACIAGRAVAQDAPPLDPDDEPLLEEVADPVSDEATEDDAATDETAKGTTDDADDANGRRLAPIVVTARKWEELVQEVPESVTVLPRTFIEDAGITDIREASYYVPNMLVSEFTTRRLSFPFIRGIGSGVGDPSVITYVDGVPQFSVSSTNLALLDVERLEFLRGPQGTLYGRNSMGGVIKYETRRPGDRMQFEARGTVGNYKLLEGRLSFETPLIDDTLSMSITGQWSAREGYTTNTFTGNDLDSKDSFSGRAQFVWTPDERNEIRFIGYGEDSDDGPFALFSLASLRANPFQVAWNGLECRLNGLDQQGQGHDEGSDHRGRLGIEQDQAECGLQHAADGTPTSQHDHEEIADEDTI